MLQKIAHIFFKTLVKSFVNTSHIIFYAKIKKHFKKIM
jgi:hypothetical protein